MTSNKNDDEIFGISQKNMRQDILLFKEEVLKDIKAVQKQFSNKFAKMEDLLKNQINIYETKVNTFEQRIKNLSDLISSDRTIIQKIEELVKFKEETKDKILTDSIRITNIESDYKLNIKNIEKILSSSVIYPGLIGYCGRFNSFHDYMDFVLNQISDLNSFKEKSLVDLTPYKKKIDESLEYIKLQVNHIISSANEFTIKSVNDCEQRMKSLIQLYDDRLQDTRVENAHYSIGLEKRSENLSILIKDMHELKRDIIKQFKEEVSNVKVDQRTLLRLITSYKKEFGIIKDKFIQLSDFIRDVRFRVNIGSDAQKKEFVSMSKKLGSSYKEISGRKTKNNKAETYELNKKYLNNNFDFLDSPNNNNQNIYHSNTFNFKRKSSLMGGSFKFSNTVINNFENSNNPKEEIKSKKSKDKSNLNKYITNFENKENDILNYKDNKKNFMRRNTTVSLPNKFNKDFSYFNQKNVNNLLNNDLFDAKKVNEENSIYSSNSNSEDKSKSDSKEKEKRKNEPSNKKENKEKSREIIKEEDENNMSEIAESSHNKLKFNKEKIISKKENITSKIINNKNTNENNDNKSSENIKDNDKDQKKEENNNIILKNEIEVVNDRKIEEKNNYKDIRENPINKDNDKQKVNIKNKNYSAKIINKKEKTVKPQTNQNELLEKLNKENERNNTISIININEMFMKNDIINRRIKFINSPTNYLFTLSLEKNFIKKNKEYEKRQSIKNKSNPSFLSKYNKIGIDSTTFNNIEKIDSKNNKTNRRYFEKYDTEGFIFEKSGQGYKTYSNFPKLGLDIPNLKKKINSKIIHADNTSIKKINEITNNFLNQKITKLNINKDSNISNNSKNNIPSTFILKNQITKSNDIYKK